jgi:hypothetical protein
LIITRGNDRRLRITAIDWVKNGDRWTILKLTRTGGLRVRHVRTGRTVTLPAEYVSTQTELGYASTVHTAQGVTADTMHGVVSGAESRQQLYTMLTRGRTANHLYVSVVGDGDPHSRISPDSLHPRTATELLEQILARDASPQSATTLHQEQHDPAARLGAAAARYLDALHLAAEHLAWPEMVVSRDQAADSLLSGLTGGPLPWLPGIPHRIAADPNWGPYLDARSHLVAELADQVRLNAGGEAPAWAALPHAPVPATLIAEVQVWRAAAQVDPSDMRPTGPPQLHYAARIFQERLDMRLAATHPDTDRKWQRLLATEVPSTTADPFLPELAERLKNLTEASFDATHLVRSAAAAGPLPDDHPAAALWWRILDQLAQMPNQNPATPNAARATGPKTTTSLAHQPPTLRPAPPQAFGPSR